MNLAKKITATILPVLLFFTVQSFAQSTEQDSLKIQIRSAARKMMEAAGTCALITLDENGLPMVRIMDPFAPESDFTVWLGTNPLSRKVQQIKRNPQVTLYYVDSDGSGYVVLHGSASLIDDPVEKEKHWKPQWKAFYPDNKEAFLLIRVRPQRMEVVSYRHGVFGDPVTWQPPSVFFN